MNISLTLVNHNSQELKRVASFMVKLYIQMNNLLGIKKYHDSIDALLPRIKAAAQSGIYYYLVYVDSKPRGAVVITTKKDKPKRREFGEILFVYLENGSVEEYKALFKKVLKIFERLNTSSSILEIVPTIQKNAYQALQELDWIPFTQRFFMLDKN